MTRLRYILISTCLVAVCGIPAHGANVTAKTKLSRGMLISASDLAVDMGQEEALNNFIGKEVIRTIYPGRPLTLRDISEPVLVRRNNRVRMIYRMGRLEINATGRAMGQGGEGEMITVLNLESRKQVDGIITGRGVVEVRP